MKRETVYRKETEHMQNGSVVVVHACDPSRIKSLGS